MDDDNIKDDLLFRKEMLQKELGEYQKINKYITGSSSPSLDPKNVRKIVEDAAGVRKPTTNNK